MKNQVLSIGQMQHLKELGIDTSKASAVILFLDEDNTCVGWDVEDHGKESQLYEVYDEDSEIWMPCHMEIMDAETGNYDHSFHDECGTFTLQDMLEMMPHIIYEEVTQRHAHLAIDYTKDKIGISYLVGSYIMLKDYRAVGSSFIEAAYIMLCWLAENKYLN